MAKLLIVGDPHLGRSLALGRPSIGSSLNGRTSDQFNLLDWILCQAIDLNVSDIIITGDVFEDQKPDYVLMIFFLCWLKKCEEHSIDVHIVMGNHDIKRSGSHYISALDTIFAADIENTKVYNQIDTVYIGEVAVTFVPFKDRRSFDTNSASYAIEKINSIIQYELAEIPDTYSKILIGHLALEGSIPIGDEFDDTQNELMYPLDLLRGYDYVWMGHVHKPQVMLSIPHIAHIGSLDLSNFGEIDHKKILIFFDSEKDSKFEEIPVPCRPLRHLEVNVLSGQDTTLLVLEKIKEYNLEHSLSNSIFKLDIILDGLDVSNVDRALLMKKLYEEYKIHYLSGIFESRKTVVIPQEKRKELEKALTVRSAIKKWKEEQISSDQQEEFSLFAQEVINEYEAKNGEV